MLIKKTASLQPRSVAAQYDLGRAALAQQDYAPAVASLEKPLSLEPLATIIDYQLAIAERGRGNRAKGQVHRAPGGRLALKPVDPLMDRLNAMLNSALADEVTGAEAMDRCDFAAAEESFRFFFQAEDGIRDA